VIPVSHSRLVARSEVDFRMRSRAFTNPFLEPEVGADFSGFPTSHTVRRYDSALGYDGYIELFCELDIANTAVSTMMSAGSSRLMRQRRMAGRIASGRHSLFGRRENSWMMTG
jgi:hypothetical protein